MVLTRRIPPSCRQRINWLVAEFGGIPGPRRCYQLLASWSYIYKIYIIPSVFHIDTNPHPVGGNNSAPAEPGFYATILYALQSHEEKEENQLKVSILIMCLACRYGYATPHPPWRSRYIHTYIHTQPAHVHRILSLHRRGHVFIYLPPPPF